jgi:transposase-like protein
MSSGDESVRRGRPVKGSALVEGLEASAEARLRLRLVLETISGSLTVEEACRQLGIGESRFHAMRQEALAAAAAGLEPAPAGRPPKPRPEDDPERQKLLAQLDEARFELQAARLREQIAIAMPHLLQSRKEELLKKSPQGPGQAPGTRQGT